MHCRSIPFLGYPGHCVCGGLAALLIPLTLHTPHSNPLYLYRFVGHCVSEMRPGRSKTVESVSRTHRTGVPAACMTTFRTPLDKLPKHVSETYGTCFERFRIRAENMSRCVSCCLPNGNLHWVQTFLSRREQSWLELCCSCSQPCAHHGTYGELVEHITNLQVHLF